MVTASRPDVFVAKTLLLMMMSLLCIVHGETLYSMLPRRVMMLVHMVVLAMVSHRGCKFTEAYGGFIRGLCSIDFLLWYLVCAVNSKIMNYRDLSCSACMY